MRPRIDRHSPTCVTNIHFVLSTTYMKARLTSVAVRISIRIRIPDPDCHQNLIICSLPHCQTSPKTSCKSVPKVLGKVANRQTDRQTDNDENITSMAEVIKSRSNLLNALVFCSWKSQWRECLRGWWEILSRWLVRRHSSVPLGCIPAAPSLYICHTSTTRRIFWLSDSHIIFIDFSQLLFT